jgi:hypothetical protein
MRPPLAINSTDPPPELIEAIKARDDSVLDWLRSQVARKMLEEIAENDNSEEVQEHLAGIQAQFYTPEPTLGLLPWNPREVLELERWSEPNMPHADLPPTQRHGHLKRVLASTILLRNAGHIAVPESLSEAAFFVETSAAALIRLTESAIAIGGEWPYLTLQFLLWFYCSQRCAIIRPFTAFSILLLFTSQHDRFQESDVVGVCRWCVAVEEFSRAALGSDVASDAWLIGLNTYEDQNGRREIWADVATRVLIGGHFAPGVADLADIVKRLTRRA